MKSIILSALLLLFISGQCYAAVELDADADGAVDVSRGGTGGITAAAARTALGVPETAATLVGDCTVGPCLDGTADGGNLIKLWAGTGSFWTALQGGAPAANRSWRLPIAAAPGAGTTRLVNMDEYGQMAFVDPAIFEPAFTADENAVTDAQLTVIGNTSGTNSGDNATNSQYSGLITLSGVAGGSVNLGTFTGTTIADSSTGKAAIQSLETAVETKEPTQTAADQTTIETGTEAGIRSMSPLRIFQAIAAYFAANVDTVSADVATMMGSANNAAILSNIGAQPAISTGNIETSGTMQGKMLPNSYTAAQTLTFADHNASIVQMTTADEVTMWDCQTAGVGGFVILWARDAEKIEVVPASGDHFNLFVGTALTADYELDIAATAGTKVTLICTADNTWSVFNETAACADGGAAD